MKKEKVQQLTHIIVGLIVLLHAFNSLDAKFLQSAIVFFGLSILFLLVAAVHKWVLKTFSNGDVAVFLLEVVTLLYAAWNLVEEEKVFKPIFFIVIALLVTLLVIYTLVTDRDSSHKSSKKGRWKRRRSSSRRLSSSSR